MAEDGFKPQVAVIGLGLLGTSLAMALKEQGLRVSGWTRRGEVREWALRQQVIDETAEQPAELLGKADITVICLPIPQIIAFIREHAGEWRSGAIVTDIGSVKEAIVSVAEEVLAGSGVYFVGGHPMAGTEKAGPEYAFKEMYRNAEVFLTRSASTDAGALAQVRRLWESIGTVVVELGVRDHDILVAHTSHISHVIALALTQAVLDCDEPEQRLRYSGCATGFRDTSRITSSSPQMWREIIENNQPAVLETVKAFEARWRHLREIIEKRQYDELQQEFAKGKQLRDHWIEYKNRTRNCGW